MCRTVLPSLIPPLFLASLFLSLSLSLCPPPHYVSHTNIHTTPTRTAEIIILYFLAAPVAAIMTRYINEFQQMKDKIAREPGTRILIQINPATQRASAWDAREAAAHHSGRMSFPRQSRHITEFMTRGLRRRAVELGLPILDHFQRSDARWFSSHDGTHYTKFVKVRMKMASNVGV